MSLVGKNIRKIRNVKKLSQSAFAEIFGLTRAAIGAYEEGRAEPKLDVIVSIANYFNISVDRLVSKEVTINEIYHIKIVKDEIKTVKPDTSGNIKIKNITHYVEIKNIPEYLENIGNDNFIQTLPQISLPFTEEQQTMAFEHFGCEMHYFNSGIFSNDLLFCKKTNSLIIEELKINGLYVIVSKKNIITRRLHEIGPVMIFKPDNYNYPFMNLPFDEILELWEVIGVYSKTLHLPSALEERVYNLEQRLNNQE